jgi:membrane protease YdiL (CAAX protease family)
MYKLDHTLILGKKSDLANNGADGMSVEREIRFPLILKAVCWREASFWLLLLPAFSSLASTGPREQIAGVIELSGFLVVAIRSAGKLRDLGLKFIAWKPVGRMAMMVSIACGLAAGAAILAVAKVADQSLGIQRGWNQAVLVIILGPVLEEIIFRGYLLTLALYLTRCLSHPVSWMTSILCVAIVFSLAHIHTGGITILQMFCIATTGTLYGWLRVRFHSTAAAALAHAVYNLTLYVGYWSGA